MTRRIAGLMITGLLIWGMAVADDQAYVTQIEKWRKDFDSDVRTGGWLTLIGRIKLDGNLWTLGGDPRSTVPLPAQAPTHLGVLTRRGQQFRFQPASDVAVTLDDKPIAADTDLSTKTGSGKLRTSGLELHVRIVGDDSYLFIIDPKNPGLVEFKGTSWYETDPAYRISARFEPYAQPQQVPVPLTHVESKETMRSTGDVVFRWHGMPVRLKSFIDEDQLFVMFLDDTNGRATYPGGRFLDAPLPTNGQTVLDFNKAFNPYCSLNPNVMCPVPPPGNRLHFSVTAGEKYTASE